MSFKKRHSFGDFQTPPELALQVCALVRRLGAQPMTVVEPSCGRGHFLAAAAQTIGARDYLGLEINPMYLRACQRRMADLCGDVRLVRADFFTADWDALLANTSDPLLVIGNPPWVTTAVAGHNAPVRSSAGFAGLDAVTGRANFDISEWMIRHLIERIATRDATLAMLCKTSVARKLLAFMWGDGCNPIDARVYAIDASRHFGAAVHACLFVCRFPATASDQSCAVFAGLDAAHESSRIAYRNQELIADLGCYERTRHLLVDSQRWRSGVKHDCSPVVELRRQGDRFRNGLGELIDIESDYVFPMLKSSELAHGTPPQRFMLVTQRHTSDSTDDIARLAPKTWRYLMSHRLRFARRASSIYRNRARFAMFGIGEYTFTPWKVAVSGFYKQIAFRAVGPKDDKPVVFDDTCYFLPCADRAQAERRVRGLSSATARAFFRAHVFVDNKRPVTARLLSRLDVDALA